MTDQHSFTDRFFLEGEIQSRRALDREDLRQFSLEFQVPDVSAVMPNMKGRGVRMSALLETAQPSVEADHVTFHSLDGKFAATLTLAKAKEYGILIYEVDGLPLPDEKGGPFRLVTPGLGDLCANVKQVARIEVTKGAGRDTRPPEVCT
ncbi:MAG: molybdopterin-dependent oxidoreductase [Nitrospirales bacterium]|nr:molybdopterin-dependent oxidoreductase [Nitrospira sp.]MDR4502945.1 molybdopterin-dependent oxidoreductase [Nitrospirales bacterium]